MFGTALGLRLGLRLDNTFFALSGALCVSGPSKVVFYYELSQRELLYIVGYFTLADC